MSLDAFQQAWKSDASSLNVSIDFESLAARVRRSEDRFRTTVFWRDVREIGASLAMIPIWCMVGFGLSLPWSWWLGIPASIWIAGFMWMDRIRHPRIASDPGEALSFYAQESLTQVDHQIWLLRNVFWWYLLPLGIPVCVFFVHVAWNATETWWGFLLFIVPSNLILVIIYRWIYRINQAAVRTDLMPRRQHLQRIVATLQEERDAGGLDELVEHVCSLSEPGDEDESTSAVSAWAENWNRIVPTWWVAAWITLPTLIAAFIGYQFAFEQAGPVFFQSTVCAVILFEILFFGRWFIASRKHRAVSNPGSGTGGIAAPAIFVLVLTVVISMFAIAAIVSFFSAARSDDSTELSSGAAIPVMPKSNAKVAPFTDVLWDGEVPVVFVNGEWWRLDSIDGIPIEDVVTFSREQYGVLARKRFTEDLVQVLSGMGHAPDWTVVLGLRADQGNTKSVEVKMTSVNRRLARFNLQLRAKYGLSEEWGDHEALSAASGGDEN